MWEWRGARAKRVEGTQVVGTGTGWVDRRLRETLGLPPTEALRRGRREPARGGRKASEATCPRRGQEGVAMHVWGSAAGCVPVETWCVGGAGGNRQNDTSSLTWATQWMVGCSHK